MQISQQLCLSIITLQMHYGLRMFTDTFRQGLWALTDQGSASVDRLNDDAYRSYGGSLTSSVNQTGFDQQIKPQCTEDVLVPQRKRQLKLYISLSKTKSKPVMKTLKLNIVCIHLATFI